MGNSQQTVLEALAEGDLVEQVGTIVRHMTNLRRRQLAEELPPQDQDLYLHCAVQLAARLRTIESEDTDYRRRVLKVMNALDTDSRLLQYDPCQDGYWERQNPNFVTGLERVTIGTLLDQYSAPDNRHAVLQAIKYRTVDERPITFDEKQAMLNTIRARQGRVPSFTRQGIVRKMLGTLFGTSLQMEDDPNDPNTLIIPSGDFSVIDSVLNEAAEMGYRRIQLHFPNDRHFDALLQALQVMLPKDAPLTEDEVRTKSVPGLLIYRNVEYVPVTITVPPPVPELPLSPPRWAFPFFSRLAQLPVSPTAEQSLRFSTLNFHSFGLQFAQELGTLARETINEPLPEGKPDQKHQCYTMVHQETIGSYQKWLLLCAVANNRYVCSFMLGSIAPGNAEVVPRVNGVLMSDLSLEQKVTTIDRVFRPFYTRLAHYHDQRLQGNFSLVN